MTEAYGEDHDAIADKGDDGHRVGRDAQHDDRHNQLENPQDDEAPGVVGEVLPSGGPLDGRTHCCLLSRLTERPAHTKGNFKRTEEENHKEGENGRNTGFTRSTQGEKKTNKESSARKGGCT